MEQEKKRQIYEEVTQKCQAVLEGENDLIAKMATVSCLLKGAFPYFYWVGFYRKAGDGLVIGPYQGTLGCLRIAMGKGVCGTAAEKRETILVKDVHEFPGHIACDAKSQSEIVVPVVNAMGELVAVLDVDSADLAAFCETDQLGLKKIVELIAG